MTSSDIGFRSERGPILIAIMLATGLVAIDATILATAVPTITQDLGGFSQFPWLFSIYLLAQAVAVPVFSKLADMYGRKPMMLIGIGIFLLGSVLCGFAPSMLALIVFRAVQGLGAAAVQPLAMTIAGDIYTIAERARVQGRIASVWAIASVVGPALGGIFSQFVGWQWIFFINIPLCLLAGGLLWRNFHEQVERRPHRIDLPGAVTLTAGLVALMLALLEGGQAWAWNSAPSIALFAAGAVLLVVFGLIERRAPEPVLPLWVYQRPLLITTSVIAFAVGAILIGFTSYVPNYLEVTVAAPPLVAGFALAAMTIGWPIAAALAGRIYLRIGFRATARIGLAIVIVGCAAFVAIAHAPSVVLTALASLVVGFGFGLAMAPTMIAAQSSVPWEQRGVVTGNNVFARAIGSAVGIAVLGAIVNGVLGPDGAGHPRPVIDATAAVYVAALLIAVLAVVGGILMPHASTSEPAPGEAAADATAA